MRQARQRKGVVPRSRGFSLFGQEVLTGAGGGDPLIVPAKAIVARGGDVIVTWSGDLILTRF